CQPRRFLQQPLHRLSDVFAVTRVVSHGPATPGSSGLRPDGISVHADPDPNLPNMGSVLKSLGYKTAYFGKFEMDKSILETKPTSGAIEPYGFDVFSAGGDIG